MLTAIDVRSFFGALVGEPLLAITLLVSSGVVLSGQVLVDYTVINENLQPQSTFLTNTPTSGPFGTPPAVGLTFHLQDMPAHTTFRFRYLRPDGSLAFDSNTFDVGNPFYSFSVWYYYWFIYRNVPGVWHILMDANGSPTIDATFTVVCGDYRDSLITEYTPQAQGGIYPNGVFDSAFTTFALFVPSCDNFTNDPQPTQNFSFTELQSPDASWAILRQSLLTGLDSILNLYGNPIYVNSGGGRAYSTPAHNVQVNHGTVVKDSGSRHMLGDAVDIPTTATTFDTVFNIAKNNIPGACVEPKKKTYPGHVHVDWRPANCPW